MGLSVSHIVQSVSLTIPLPVLLPVEFFAPALLIIAPLVFLEIIRPGAIEEAEENGMFNTTEYLQNNDLQDQMWDVMLQFFGMGSGPPTGVWDESNEYIQNNPNVQRNLEDIKNMKESARALWDGALALFLPDDRAPTLEELADACWSAGYLLMGMDKDTLEAIYHSDKPVDELKRLQGGGPIPKKKPNEWEEDAKRLGQALGVALLTHDVIRASTIVIIGWLWSLGESIVEILEQKEKGEQLSNSTTNTTGGSNGTF